LEEKVRIFGILVVIVIILAACSKDKSPTSSTPYVDPPVFSPAGGYYVEAQTVTITCAAENATIRYTTDGSDPSGSSSIYSSPIGINANTTLKAIALDEGGNASDIVLDRYAFPLEGFVHVPAGTFQMGDTRGTTEEWSGEYPVHTVTLSSFYAAMYEVTQADWIQVMGGNPSHEFYGIGDDLPVNGVDWYSILIYCNLLSIDEGLSPCYSINASVNPSDWGAAPDSTDQVWDAVVCEWSNNGYRMLTEAEWEYAARGATNTPDYLYAGSDILNEVAYVYSAQPGGMKAPNGLGLYDMSGNVSEWCWDYRTSYPQSGQTNPTGPEEGVGRIFRGGNWCDSAYNCRVSFRFAKYPGFSGYNTGVRLGRTI